MTARTAAVHDGSIRPRPSPPGRRSAGGTRVPTPGRRSEALFLLGALAAARGDQADAQSRWKEIVTIGLADLIEYAAARNQLAKL